MWTAMRVLTFLGCLGVVLAAAATISSSQRPKNCAVGTSYKKDCNTCTCATVIKDDKCSSFDCDRAKQSTTSRPVSTGRPGVCPTRVTPRPGIDDCSKRNQTSVCKIDKDCSAAKKCCQNGCGINLCRNAIYPNTP